LFVTESEIIDEIGRRLAAAAPAGSRIVLFGSRARGEADRRSDYDVLVMEPAVENAASESARLRRELDDLRAPIDVLVVPEDLARRRATVRGTVVERALREGRVLADA
jgi:predicted nucleotidyltransferase